MGPLLCSLPALLCVRNLVAKAGKDYSKRWELEKGKGLEKGKEKTENGTPLRNSECERHAYLKHLVERG